MSTRIIRLQCHSLNAPGGKEYQNVLLYIKKLSSTPSSDGQSIQLEERDPDSSLVLSFNEPYEIFPDNEFFQILFLQSRNETKLISDIVFYRPYLYNILDGWMQIRDIQERLITHASLDHKNTLTFSLQFVDVASMKKSFQPECSNHQLIRGHSMVLTKFNDVTYCAICTKLIKGFRPHGYKCERCSITTDQRCHKRIPFCCQIAPSSIPLLNSESPAGDYRLEHAFKHYQPPFYRINLSCKNCGLNVSRNAMKCTQCKFIIHADCQASVPPLCAASYEALARAGDNRPKSVILPEPVDHDGTISNRSTTFSILPCIGLASLPHDGLIYLPKLSDFEYIGHFGDGGYSSVYCVQHIQSKEYVAIKVVDGTDELARQQFEMERQILFRYSGANPYMIKGYCSFHQGSRLYLIMECVGDDTIMQNMQRQQMNENDIRYYLAEIISVIQYLHSKNVVYRDLKLDHILVSSEGHIRLIDFGLARILKSPDDICDTICGTRGYVSPEVQRLGQKETTEGYSYPVDFWAIGKIFVEMLLGEPFDPADDLNDVLNLLDNFPDHRHISAEARSLAHGLLENDPKKRLGSPDSPHGDLRLHPFFQKGKATDWEAVDECLTKATDSPLNRRPSDTSIDLPFPITSLNRGPYPKRDWIKAIESTCDNIDEENQFKTYDHVSLPLWYRFLQSK